MTTFEVFKHFPRSCPASPSFDNTTVLRQRDKCCKHLYKFVILFSDKVHTRWHRQHGGGSCVLLTRVEATSQQHASFIRAVHGKITTFRLGSLLDN